MFINNIIYILKKKKYYIYTNYIYTNIILVHKALYLILLLK